ncbi:MAG TPA: peptidylprolyl isomerase [Acidimicrobiia bacterium]|nr:peptidylprolyl isomerase [Acidimicrobiia bacterium]
MSDRRRRQKENRAARREAEEKAEGRKEIFRRLGFALGMGALVVLSFVVVSLFGQDSESLPGSYEGYRNQTTACGAEAPPPEAVMSFTEPVAQDDITADSTVTATITTSCGDIVMELDAAGYPETVNSFVFLTRQDFFDGTVFHRIVADFVVQGGDPDAVGTGGPGYRIPDEFPDGEFEFTPGMVAMANAGRSTTGSQFFIVVGDQASVLNPLFNVLGEVTEGMDVLDRIAAVPTATRPGSREQSLPLETVYIEDIQIDVS